MSAEEFLKDKFKRIFTKDLPMIGSYQLPQLLEEYAKLERESKVKKLSSNLPVIGSAICDAIDANQVQKVDRHVGMFLEIEKAIKLHLL